MMTMTTEGGGWVSARQPLAHCAATHIRPVVSSAPVAPANAADQGRNVAEHSAVLPSRDARVIASAREWELLCAGFSQLDQRLTVPVLALMHALVARVIP
jgi:hypothetical protein